MTRVASGTDEPSTPARGTVGGRKPTLRDREGRGIAVRPRPARRHFFFGPAVLPLSGPTALAAGLTTFFSAAFATVLAAPFTASAAFVTGPFFAAMRVPLRCGRSPAVRGTGPTVQNHTRR